MPGGRSPSRGHGGALQRHLQYNIRPAWLKQVWEYGCMGVGGVGCGSALVDSKLGLAYYSVAVDSKTPSRALALKPLGRRLNYAGCNEIVSLSQIVAVLVECRDDHAR